MVDKVCGLLRVPITSIVKIRRPLAPAAIAQEASQASLSTRK